MKRYPILAMFLDPHLFKLFKPEGTLFRHLLVIFLDPHLFRLFKREDTLYRHFYLSCFSIYLGFLSEKVRYCISVCDCNVFDPHLFRFFFKILNASNVAKVEAQKRKVCENLVVRKVFSIF